MHTKELLLHAIYDSEHVRRNTIIQIVIATLAFVLLCCVWPSGMVQKHTKSVQQAFSSTKNLSGDAFTSADKKLQTVRFSENHIHQIMMYLSCEKNETNQGYVMFRLYNDTFSCIYEETQNFGTLKKQGGFLATPDIDVDTDRDYYYEVIIPEETEGSLIVPVAGRGSLMQKENTILYVDGIYHEDISLVADFDYTEKLSVVAILCYDILILALAVLCYVVVIWLLYRFEAYISAVCSYGKWVATVLSGIAAVVMFALTVVCNVFGGAAWDRVVYAVGVIVGVFWLMCAIWMPRQNRNPAMRRVKPDRQISLIWRNYIQTVSFALLFYALCEYVNADREYFHYTNTRWMLIFMGIAFLMIQSEKEFLGIISYIWTGLALIGAFIYCNGFTDEQELYLAKLSAAVVLVWGLVVINAFIQCRKACWKTISKPFLAVWFLFVLFMFIYRFDKTWPFTATLPFAVLLLYNLNAVQKSRLLKNFTNGILLSFGLVLLFCLHHRPYHYWMRYRYNMIFHTVACTGMYLAMVFAAAIGKLYGKWKNKDCLFERCWKELFILSTVIAFILFSMARTAILTAAVNFILVAVLALYVYRKGVVRFAKECGVIALAAVMSFPLMFSAIRMIPALANDPIRYEIEPQEQSYMIYKNDPIDSDKYMTIERYFDVFFSRFRVEGESGDEVQIQEIQKNLLVYTGMDQLPVGYEAEEEKEGTNEYVLEGNADISNGRFEIYREYLQNLKLSGHEKMMLEGKDYAHAHNSYIQVAYDFGIIAGIIFLIYCVCILIKSVLLYVQHGEKYSIFMVPFSLIINFGIISVTEWAFHPCIPIGFCFLFLTVVLMQEISQADKSGIRVRQE